MNTRLMQPYFRINGSAGKWETLDKCLKLTYDFCNNNK